MKEASKVLFYNRKRKKEKQIKRRSLAMNGERITQERERK